MATRTYAVGTKSGVRRLDDLTTPWVDVPVLITSLGFPITVILLDVMTDSLDSSKVFVVGQRDLSSGATGIYLSDNAGAIWYQPTGDITAGTYNFYNLYEVWVVDSNVIFTCGQGGVVYKSLDGGATFNTTTTFPTPSTGFEGASGNSYALHFITDQIGVVGFEETVYKTIDGGATWSILNGGASLSTGTSAVFGIHMSADGQTLTAITSREILHSTDAGASWSVVEAFFSNGKHLSWLDDTTLFAFGLGNDRKVSIDGGATWTTVSITSITGPDHVAGHMYSATSGFYDQDANTMVTADGLVTGTISEVAPYLIQAIWTHLDPPADEPCGCPEDTVYNPITNECDGFMTMNATNAGTTYGVAAGDQKANYSQAGAYFFENIDGKPLPIKRQLNFSQPNFDDIVDSTNTLLNIQTIVSNNGWGNGSTPLNGRLNVAGVWSDIPYSGAFTDPHLPIYEWIGFTACVETSIEKVYYIGIAADNRVRIKVNGVLVVQLLQQAIRNFTRWNMFPITLPAGTNFVELEGLNVGSYASFGAEIYDADYATLIAMTTESQINSVLVFSTKDKIGTTFDIGDNIGWNCPPGWTLSFCEGYPQCVQTITAPFEPCNCYLATNCENPTEQILLTTEDPLDLTMTYVFYGHPDKCWTVEISVDCPPNDVITDVAQAWLTCEACVGVCYTLIDCEGVEPPIQVSNDLSQYLDPFGVGKIIQLTRCPEVCWQIVVNLGHCTGAEEEVIITEDFETCEECIGVDPEIPLMLNHRKIEPGYDTPACSIDYFEKVECRFAEAMYQEVISERYGIEFCCEIDAMKYEIKHEDLKLRLITDPNACIAVPIDCCPPCNVTAVIIRECPEPEYVFGRIIR